MAIAIGAGAIAALAAGGWRGGARPALHWVPLLLLSAVTLVVLEAGGVPARGELAAIVLADAAVLAFSVRNVVLAGVALNVLVTLANGGMPVEGDAVVRAGIAERSALRGIDLGPKRHLATEDDVLVVLDDRIPVRPLREVVSLGDVVLAAGLAVVTLRLLRPGSDRRATPTSHAATTGEASEPAGGHDRRGS